MPDDPKPYVEVKPSDLITADLFNTVQIDVQKDIAQKVQTAVAGVTAVKHADDAGTLGGLDVDKLTNQILDRVKAMIPGRTGYKRTFNLLKPNQPKLIKHNLGVPPLVDVYQLDYFEAVCAHGENAADAVVEFVNFYLYHESEKQIRATDPNSGLPAKPKTVTIEDPNFPQFHFRLAFKDLLAELGVNISNKDMTLDELVTSFWSALFADDAFFPEQYCHSPWLEKCCGELRSIKDLQARGDWERLWLKVVPRKTINYPAAALGTIDHPSPPVLFPLTLNGQAFPASGPSLIPLMSPGPTQIEVAHLDYNSTGILLISDPVPQKNAPPDIGNDLAVMVLMKV